MVDLINTGSNMKRKVGWFVMLGIGALIFLLLIVSVRSNVFAQKFYLFVEPPSASAFHEGQPVQFQGFPIGHIDQIELQNEGQVRISLRLLERYRQMLHQDAVIRLVKEGLLGEQVVGITTGDIKKAALENGAYLKFETEASLEQLLIDLKPAVGNANILLSELAELSAWMNDPYGDLRAGMAGLRGMTAGVQGASIEAAVREFTQTLVKLKHVAVDLDEHKVALHLAESLEKTSNILGNIEPLSKSLGESGPNTVQHVNKLLAHVDELSGALNVVAVDLSQMTPELPGLARESRATLAEMRSMLKSLQHSWLLGGSSQEPIKQENIEIAPPVLDMQP